MDQNERPFWIGELITVLHNSNCTEGIICAVYPATMRYEVVRTSPRTPIDRDQIYIVPFTCAERRRFMAHVSRHE